MGGENWTHLSKEKGSSYSVAEPQEAEVEEVYSWGWVQEHFIVDKSSPRRALGSRYAAFNWQQRFREFFLVAVYIQEILRTPTPDITFSTMA